jgi:hypothetical protein
MKTQLTYRCLLWAIMSSILAVLAVASFSQQKLEVSIWLPLSVSAVVVYEGISVLLGKGHLL